MRSAITVSDLQFSDIMKTSKNYIFIILSAVTHTLCTAELIDDSSLPSNSSSFKLYNAGIELGIINAEKYSYDAFATDEQHIFRDLYKEYMHINSNHSMNYEDWLIMNNFGILSDTQEPLIQRKITKRSTADNKRRFVNMVKKGDILITGRGVGGLIGHAAIMTTDYWVLEMPGGKGVEKGLKDNNRQMAKDKWFDLHASDWTTVYRNRDSSVAHQAAVWADHNYYNPTGGIKKTKHITYKISYDIFSLNPSYCSKLVIQAYYYGTGKKRVIHELTIAGKIIVPSTIPSFFLSPYGLVNKGKY